MQRSNNQSLEKSSDNRKPPAPPNLNAMLQQTFDDYNGATNLSTNLNTRGNSSSQSKVKDLRSLRDSNSQRPNPAKAYLNNMSQKYIASSGRNETRSPAVGDNSFFHEQTVPGPRQPSAKSRAAAFRQKAKIYTNRNVNGSQVISTTTSTKNSNKVNSTK